MPADEPTPDAGDAASHGATFRGAERVDEHTGETPAVRPDAQATDRAPGDGGASDRRPGDDAPRPADQPLGSAVQRIPGIPNAPSAPRPSAPPTAPPGTGAGSDPRPHTPPSPPGSGGPAVGPSASNLPTSSSGSSSSAPAPSAPSSTPGASTPGTSTPGPPDRPSTSPGPTPAGSGSASPRPDAPPSSSPARPETRDPGPRPAGDAAAGAARPDGPAADRPAGAPGAPGAPRPPAPTPGTAAGAAAATGLAAAAASGGDRSSSATSTTSANPAVTGPSSGRSGADDPTGSARRAGSDTTAAATPGRVRARKVRRIVRHIEPWSVLKISMLFYAALFLIVCVASALLWGAARTSGTVENVESFITSVGGFGNCEPIDGSAPVTTTVPPAVEPDGPVDQIDPGDTEEIDPEPGDTGIASPSDDEDCREGEELVGEFRFEDGRIFQAFTLGGIVLVLAGTAANVVMVLLFNLMSDLTGGVRLTVLEEDPPSRSRSASGSPPPRPRD